MSPYFSSVDEVPHADPALRLQHCRTWYRLHAAYADRVDAIDASNFAGTTFYEPLAAHLRSTQPRFDLDLVILTRLILFAYCF
jgi:hypothetical protein